MGCKSFGVHTVLVGLYRVGVVGLEDAFKKVDESGVTDQAAILDLLMATLANDNYVPEPQMSDFRRAALREYLRHKGEDFSEHYSEIDVTVIGEAGDERDRFVEILRAVMAQLELTPVITRGSASDGGPTPRLVIGEETIIEGAVSRNAFKTAVRKSISDW